MIPNENTWNRKKSAEKTKKKLRQHYYLEE
jgi:hypothetical protein